PLSARRNAIDRLSVVFPTPPFPQNTMIFDCRGATARVYNGRSIRGRSRGRHFDQAVFETIVDLALLRVAQIPAVGLLESDLERGRLKAENALGLHHYFRDRRHVQ